MSAILFRIAWHGDVIRQAFIGCALMWASLNFKLFFDWA
jgi:hypothetical protein